jgi:hypothetical protein
MRAIEAKKVDQFQAPERRLGARLPLEMYLTAYFQEEPRRGFTTNISDQGLHLSTLRDLPPLPPNAHVTLEFELPGVPVIIWAAGQVRFERTDDYFFGQGIHFTAMARRHRRLIYDFCLRRFFGRFQPLALP